MTTYKSIRRILQEKWEVIVAFKEGRVIQVSDRYEPNQWKDYTGEDPSIMDDACLWRVKPSPSYRPWKPSEVPCPLIIRHDNWPKGNCTIVTETINNSAYFFSLGEKQCVTFERLLEYFKYTPDNGKTWLPCGTEL